MYKYSSKYYVYFENTDFKCMFQSNWKYSFNNNNDNMLLTLKGYLWI